MAAAILHVSDLHIGSRRDADVGEALGALVAHLQLGLVVATGDLTHRGRRDQHERAQAFLRGLGPPVVAVPGNHDLPHTLPARISRPWAEFERLWETTQPVYEADGVYVVGLNSVRPTRHQSGGLRDAQLAWAAERFAEAPAGALRVAAMHHQMIGAPWRTRKRPVASRNRVLVALLDAGVELVVSGHTHQAAVAERHEFEAWVEGQAGMTVCTAPGLGRPRPHRRGEARGLHVYEADARWITVTTYAWRGNDWAQTAVRRFSRGADPPATLSSPPAR